MKKANSIGFYDTGLGGLVVLKEVIKIFPTASIKYLADNEALPLGNKPISEIKERIKNSVDYLLNNGCSLVILACNTASVTSIREIQQNHLVSRYRNKNVLGINIPLIENLKKNYHHLINSNGVVLSTKATHESEFYQRELQKLGFKNTKSIWSNNLAETIESSNSKAVQKEVDNVLSEVNANGQRIDLIILACTHYPLAIKQIKKRLPLAIIVSQGRDIALKLKEYLIRHKDYRISNGSRQYLKTKNVEGFDKKASRIIGSNIAFDLVKIT